MTEWIVSLPQYGQLSQSDGTLIEAADASNPVQITDVDFKLIYQPALHKWETPLDQFLFYVDDGHDTNHTSDFVTVPISVTFVGMLFLFSFVFIILYVTTLLFLLLYFQYYLFTSFLFSSSSIFRLSTISLLRFSDIDTKRRLKTTTLLFQISILICRIFTCL